MPLKSGKSNATVSENIRELMHSFHGSGKIGTSAPSSNQAASKQAAAIAYSKAGRSKAPKPSWDEMERMHNMREERKE